MPGFYRRIFVPDGAAGRRVDVFLTLRFPEWSRTTLARHIREGAVIAEDRPLKPSSTIRVGDVLRIYVPGIAPTGESPPLPPVLYEDEALLVLNKPPGMLTHPVGQRWEYGLIGIAREARPGLTLALAHRLDRDTSGVVVLTKGTEADRYTKAAFKERRVEKTYLAMVRGVVPWEEHTVDAPLGHAGAELELRRGVIEGGDPAITRFRVVERLPTLTLVECKPFTGRTHQIRAHLEHAGFPILGDKVYGQPDAVFLAFMREGASAFVRESVGFPRQCLHAFSLQIPHPISGERLTIDAPLPEDMAELVAGKEPRWEEGVGVLGVDTAEAGTAVAAIVEEEAAE